MAKLVAGGVTLRDQLNARFPDRDKQSDGWIGDSAHAARGSLSDHNPDKNGWVHAIDIDENFGHGKWRNGRNAQALANQLLTYARSGLPGSGRVKYVIYENAIASATHKATWFRWRKGNWGHTAHIHVSFNTSAQKDGQEWPLPILGKTVKQRRAWAAALAGK
jgi:hypothetical protein